MISALDPNSIMTANYLVDSVNDLTTEAGKVKIEIFKNIEMGDPINKKPFKYFLGYTNSYLSTFEKYGKAIADKMKHANPSKKDRIVSIPYDEVKPYVYDTYDYASALKFIDSLMNKINSKDVEDDSDVRDLFDEYAAKNFGDHVTSVAGIVDEATTMVEIERTEVSSREIGHFSAVKSQKLFNDKDLTSISKTVEKVFDFFCNNIDKESYLGTNNHRLIISFINNSMEYITYTIVAYAVRVYVITNYGYDYTKDHIQKFDAPITEAVDMSYDFSEIDIMKKLDESIVRDDMKMFDYFDAIQEFLTTIGATLTLGNAGASGALDDLKKYHFTPRYPKDNIVCNALISNPFFEFLQNRIYGLYGDNWNTALVVDDLKEELDSYLDNSAQALPTRSTAKQSMLQIIRGLTPNNETKEGYKELASQLASFAIVTLYSLYDSMNNVEQHRVRESNDPRYNTTFLTSEAAIIKSLHSFYKEFAVAVLMKFRDIEMKINDLDNADNDVLRDMLTIKIPGKDVGDDYSHNDNMMSGVADTERIPSDLINLYAKPVEEYCNMLLEWKKSIPGMENDIYLTEAAGFIDKLLAWLAGILKAIQNKWANKKFKTAIKWVSDHQGMLNQLKIKGEMDVLPYTNPIQINYIEDVVNKISSFDPSTVTNPDALEAFIKSLYPTTLSFMYDTTENSTKDTNDVTKYNNWVLFGLDPKSAGSQNVQTKKLVDNAINAEMSKVWIPTIISADRTADDIVKTSNDITNAIKNIQQKMASTSSGTTNNTTQPAQNNAQQMPNITDNTQNQQNNNANQNQNNNQQQQQQNNNGVTPELITNKIQAALNDLWGHLEPAVYKAVADEYKYIQQAYNIGVAQNSNNQTNNQNTNQNQ